MLSRQIRHWAVAIGLVAAVGITAASAAGSVTGRFHAASTATPAVSGDLGEVVVIAPRDFSEVVVRAPHDLGDVLVDVRGLPAAGQYLADIVVTALPVGGYARLDRANAALALVR